MPRSDFVSPYTPNTFDDRRRMLDAIGVSSSDDLFQDIPSEYLNPSLDLPPPASEFDLRREIEAMAKQNAVPGDYACFLGAGSYRHHVPSVVRQVAGRSEFMTSYTPYQPEVSQGTLQAHYEFQSMVCQLTGMEVANSGMYDGATSLAESALMAARITKRDRVTVLDTVSPRYLAVLQTYFQGLGVQIDTLPRTGVSVSDQTACLIVQQPRFLGELEDLDELSEIAHKSGALFIVSADPVALGIFKPPGEFDADIVVAEGQSLGIAPTFGGPYVGIFACKERHIRQMPGRIVGKTTDDQGRTGYVLTLQTREQHIRRERATSNICTSVGLIALMSTIFMAAYGKDGLRHLAQLCYHKAHYAASHINKVPGYKMVTAGPFFREFVVECPVSPSYINERLLDYGIIGGLDVSDQIPKGMLVCCTDVNTKEEIDSLASALAEIGGAV